MKVSFFYEKMGMNFYRDFNGETYKLGDDRSNGNPSITYKSENGLHKLKFSDGKRRVTVDGRSFDLIPALETANKIEISRVEIYNNGSWEIAGGFYSANGSWKRFEKGFANGILKDLSTTNMSVHPTKGFVDSDDINVYEGFYTVKPFDSRGFDYIYDGSKDDGRLDTQFLIKGKNPNDEFMSHWKYDYVLINDKKVGEGSAIDAWYDPNLNAFVWITIENNKLVENAYGL